VRVVLKRGVKLFAVSAAFVTATLGFAYLVDSMGAGVVRRWIAGWIVCQPDQEEPLLYVHVYVTIGWGELLGLLLLYFVVCLALAWCWTWIKTRTTHT
jgi:hypothetical protein